MHAFFKKYIADLVYGANDGIITTFAVVAGATGAALSSQTIIVLGLANLVADGFSMGASSYLSISSEKQVKAHGGISDTRGPLVHGTVTFISFIIAGALPLLPFLIAVAAEHTFVVSAVATATAFFVVGGMRSLLTRRSFFLSGLEMLFVGGIASILAYGVGYSVQALVL